jgi:phage terminase small subunit
MPLTEKQEVFVREYLIDMNGTQAAIRTGYSRKTANEQAARLLAKVSVRLAIDKAVSERSERLNLDADWVIKRFRALYLEALCKGDLPTAARSLENIGKHLGFFEKHNWQKKRYTQDDVEKLKAELEMKGFNFERVGLRSAN